MAFSKPSTYQDHQISTRGLYSSKFTVPPCSCFDIFSDLQIPWECQHHFTQQKPSPRRGLPSGQERTCHSSSARKVPCCLEYNPRMPWDAVFACMARHAKQFWDNEVRRPAFQFITKGSSPSLLAPMVTVGTAPQNLASAPGQRALPDGGRAGSLPFEGKSRTTK